MVRKGEAGLRLHESFGCRWMKFTDRKKNIPLTSVHSIAGIDQNGQNAEKFLKYSVFRSICDTSLGTYF